MTTNQWISGVFLMVKLELGVEGLPPKSVVATLTVIQVRLDTLTVELPMALTTLRGCVQVAVSTALSFVCMTLTALGLGMFSGERPACLHMIKGSHVELDNLVSTPFVLLVTKVTVYISWDPPVVSFSAPDPLVNLSVTVSTFRGLCDIDVITVAFPTFVRCIKMCVNFREWVSSEG